MFEAILVAVDGSQHGQHAAAVAGDLARAVQARELLIVVAFEAIPGYLGEPWLSQAISARKEQAQQILDKAKEAVGGTSAQIDVEMVEGTIAEAILNVAKIRKCDVIVMGSRGFGRIEGAVLGSNSQKVVGHAPCPVLIVR
ncbi:MAG TPA: universal stress protein [Anaerolineales bacterium]|nr:universal stress protein [Anaerolineales bacterium]